MTAKRIILFVCVAFMFGFGNMFSQSDLFIPKNILKAYDSGTRSLDGKPGKNYWVNKSDYKILAEIFPEIRTIKGSSVIKYYNNSPDTLNSFVIRLYQDILKKGGARDFPANPNDLTDGIKIDTLIINNVGVDFKSKSYRVLRSSTNLYVSKFTEKVSPKSSAEIEIKWSVVLPSESRLRMGTYNDSTFFAAYWYPQISVYDDIDGWDNVEYGGSVEFYNDVGNFDVQITTPKDYLVWATGVIQNAENILHPKILERYKNAMESNEVIRIITEEDYKNKSVLKSSDKNTWHFIAENVPDFSFAACKSYLWDGVGAKIDSDRNMVFTDAVYPIKNKFQDEVASFAKMSVEYFSNEWPAWPFPYPKITVFNGEQNRGGGMETPMMCNNGTYQNRIGQLGVTVHEISHTYFPFYMGTNERKYAWMDEGWATFLTYDLVKRSEPSEDELPGAVNSLNNSLGNDFMIPMITPSYSVRTRGGGTMFYQQASVSYLILRDMLGDDLFKKCLHDYIYNWKGKHPIPYDFFFTFNRVAGEDLSWFWKPWFFEWGYPELSIKQINDNKEIIIEKLGNMPVPVDLKLTFEDGSGESFHKSAMAWKNGEGRVAFYNNTGKKIVKAELLTILGPDTNLKNNVVEIK